MTGSLTGPAERTIAWRVGQTILLPGANGSIDGILIQLSHLTGEHQIGIALPEHQDSRPSLRRWAMTYASFCMLAPTGTLGR